MDNTTCEMIAFAEENRSSDDVAVLRGILSFIEDSTGLKNIWYWYPLFKVHAEIPYIAYDLDRIYDDNAMRFLDEIIEKCGISSAISFQLQMSENGLKERSIDLHDLIYKADDDGYSFPWDVETYYYDRSEKWLIYVSHEGSISFAGNIIVSAVKETIPSAYAI